MNRSNVLAAAAVTVFSLGATLSFAATKADIDKDVATSLSDFNALHASNAGLVKKAAGMLVFPHITKGGVGVAGEFGEGALAGQGQDRRLLQHRRGLRRPDARCGQAQRDHHVHDAGLARQVHQQ